jgi:hypothetical protein
VGNNGVKGRTGGCSAPGEWESHDRALRARPFYAAETQLLEQLLPTKVRIGRVPIRPSAGPAFDGRGPSVAGQFDRRTHERVSDALATVIIPDEEAGQEPNTLVLGAGTITHDLASSADGGGVPRPRTAGAPADRLTSRRSQNSHRRRPGRHGLETMPVAAIQPASCELGTGRTKRHTPAAASVPLTLEQRRQGRQLSMPHGPSLDIRAHRPETTGSATRSGTCGSWSRTLRQRRPHRPTGSSANYPSRTMSRHYSFALRQRIA